MVILSSSQYSTMTRAVRRMYSIEVTWLLWNHHCMNINNKSLGDPPQTSIHISVVLIDRKYNADVEVFIYFQNSIAQPSIARKTHHQLSQDSFQWRWSTIVRSVSTHSHTSHYQAIITNNAYITYIKDFLTMAHGQSLYYSKTVSKIVFNSIKIAWKHEANIHTGQS